MKKQARLIVFIAVIMLACLLALTLSACGEDKPDQAKKASHITFETPENSLANPISTDDFKFSDVKLYVVYDDGSKGKAVTFNESMLSAKNTGNIDDIPVGGKSRVIFTASYTVDGTTFEGTFGIYLRKPDNVEKVTYKFYTNGANVEDFELRIPVGTVFKTYKEFLEYLGKNHEPVAKTRYTLAGWLDTQGQDVAGMEAAQIERNYGRYNMERNFVEIEVKKGVSNYFYATWSKNVAEVTFNYNFSQFSMEGVSFAHVTPKINVNADGTAEEDRKTRVSNSNPIVTEYYTMGYDVAQRPNTYKIDSLGSLEKLPTPLQEIVDGYTFEGWYTDAKLTQSWSFSGVVKDNMTLYAKWARKQYSITLDLGGGFFNPDYVIVEDGKLKEKDDYGYFTLRGEVERTSSLKDVNDATAKEVPSVIRYTGLNYKANVFGTTNKSYYLLKSLTNMNTATGRVYYKGKVSDSVYYYNFAGWYYDANFNKPFDLNNNSFTEDLYLFAKWELVSDSSLQANFYKDYLFKNCLELKPDGTYKITGINDKTVTTFKIPAQIGGIFVTEIGANAFSSCLSLLKVEIEGGESSKLSKIGDKAFAFCSKLSEINKICDGTSFNYDLFNVDYNNAQQKQLVHLPNLEDIGVDVFQGTEYLQNKRKTMNFLEYQGRLIQYIGDTTVTNVVSSFEKLPDDNNGGAVIDSKNYTLDKTNPLLYVYTAAGEPTLKYVYFPSGITTINPYTFKNLTNLKSIVIPNTVTEIGDSCFSKCSILSDFVIDEIEAGSGEYSLEEIGPSALADTLWLSGQSALVTIGKILYSFRGGNDTTQVTIPDGIEIIADNLFMSNDNLRVVTFQNESRIKKIGKNAFNATAWYRTMGENNNGFVVVNGIMIGYTLRPAAVDGKVVVTVPNTIRELASYAFSNTNTITHISLPSSIEKIDAYAFDACTRLQTISFGHLVLADESGTLPKNPVLLEKSGNLSVKAFFNKDKDNLVSADVKLYFTLDRVGTSANCFELAANHDSLKAYYDNNNAFIQELKIISENGIRVKAGTLPTEYVRNSGWTLSNYWLTTGAFDKKAIIQIEKTDGLVYEEYLSLENVSDFTNDLTPSSDEDIAKYGMNIYNGKRSLLITYDDANGGAAHTCRFEYTIRPKVDKIVINATPDGTPTLMSLATYFVTSNTFVYKGGSATISYDLNGVSSQIVSLEKLMSLAKIEGNNDVKFTIENLMFTNAQTYSLTFKFVFGLQTIETPYEYNVNTPTITKISEKNLIEFDIAAEITKAALTNVYLTMSRNDPLSGGQIYATDGINVSDGGSYEITGQLYSYNNIPTDAVITKYIVYYTETDESGKVSFVENLVDPTEIGNYLRNQDITIADGSILLYSDDEFTKKLTKFDTSYDGEHVIYVKYSSSNGAVGGSAIRYNVALRTSQSLFTYTVKDGVNPYGADFDGVITDEDGNVCVFKGLATITGIGASHWSTVSIPEYITKTIETAVTNKNKVDLQTGIAYKLDENGERLLDENNEPVIDTDFIVKKDVDGNVFVDENGNAIELTYEYYVVTAIGDSAFYNANTQSGDSILAKVYFSKYVTSIGKDAFKACENLNEIDLLNDEASGVVSIGESAFEGCIALQTVPFDSVAGGVLKELGRCAFKKSGLTKFNFANVSVVEIEEQLFYECGSLVDVNLGAVEIINNQAFVSCVSLVEIVIPVSVNEIGNYVFSACNALEKIVIEDTDPNKLAIGGFEPFGSATNLLKIYVDKDSVEAFKTNSQYALYKELILAK